ncbi:hypothetical protein Godav_005282 [Gossypium davidsonii]|uniref:Rab-GAP TBC domain-containing protein n=1 Tax=Gossypium davidsonii TaxID=34287 RepID=A0A7J8T8W8_GOSDV|nr:hypothetical protein [Gossypium davidsonii]
MGFLVLRDKKNPSPISVPQTFVDFIGSNLDSNLAMAKERIPDWLNSSLWSTTPSVDDRLHRFSLSPTTTTTTAAAADSEPIVQPTVPVSPPAAASRPQYTVTSQKYEFRDPIDKNSNNNSNDNDQNDSPCGVSPDDISRQAQLLAELSKKVVNFRELRRIASQGIPDGAGIRSTVWKLLLGYLPPDRLQWSSELAKKRSEYKQFKEELLMNPVSVFFTFFILGFLNVSVASQTEITRKLEKSAVDDHSKSESSGLLSRSQVTHGEHPLSLGESIWNQFFQDTEIIEQIDRDVKRTHPDMHFFSGDSPLAKSNQDALKDILIVFAKLNPGIRYVQGMNEILAPLFYVFRNDPDEEMAAAAEADSFFCFVELLSGFRDHFCKQLDNSTVGIRSTISRLSQFLKEHDEELWRHLEITTKVNPQFYAFRWITLLLTQEFNFADSLHIWDTLLSDPKGPLAWGCLYCSESSFTLNYLFPTLLSDTYLDIGDFYGFLQSKTYMYLQETLLRVCCAMLILVRRRLLAGDFTSNLKLLQNYPSSNISHLLYVANKLRSQASN